MILAKKYKYCFYILSNFDKARKNIGEINVIRGWGGHNLPPPPLAPPEITALNGLRRSSAVGDKLALISDLMCFEGPI